MCHHGVCLGEGGSWGNKMVICVSRYECECIHMLVNYAGLSVYYCFYTWIEICLRTQRRLRQLVASILTDCSDVTLEEVTPSTFESDPTSRPASSESEESIDHQTGECFGSDSANEDSDVEDSSLSDASSFSSDSELDDTSTSSFDDSVHSHIPLYFGSPVDANHFEVVLMSLIQKHNLTYSCQDDIIKMLSTILPSPAQIPSSSYVLRGKFVKLHEVCKVYYFCSRCFISLSSLTRQCDSAGCVALPQQSPSQYIHISVQTA